MSVALEQAVRIPSDVMFRELQGEAVILDLTSSTYFGLDHVGTRIWQLCATHASLRAVCEAMQHEFDAPHETLQVDLLAFVDELVTKGLLEVQPNVA